MDDDTNLAPRPAAESAIEPDAARGEEATAGAVPAVDWEAAVRGAPEPRIGATGAALALIAGVGGLLAAILPYGRFAGDTSFVLVNLSSPADGEPIWLAIEPIMLAGGLVLSGVLGLARPSRTAGGLVLGLGIALLLNHGGFLGYLLDPDVQGTVDVGLVVGTASGLLAVLGALLSLVIPRRPAPAVV